MYYNIRTTDIYYIFISENKNKCQLSLQEDNKLKKNLVCIFTAFACAMALTACSKTENKNGSDSGSQSKSSAESSAASSSQENSDKKQDIDKNTGEKINELSVSDARNIVAENIDTEKYQILDGKTSLEIDGNGYYVFIVADKSDNKPIGQIAVDKKTGKKYNYKGEDTIEDYSKFTLYNAATDMKADWEGTFTDGKRNLELLPMDESSFEYILDGDDGGVAQATGNTAKDATRDVTFTYGQDGSITISGEVTGVFKRA